MRNTLPALVLLGVAGLVAAQVQNSEPTPKVDRVVVDKSERTLSLLAGGAVVKSYRVALGSDPVGPKQQEGDGRTPEGVYVIDYRNPKSRYHLSLHVSYPNSSDEQAAAARGVSPGGDIFIHGLPPEFAWIGKLHTQMDWTKGCIAVTDGEIEELWEAVPNGTPIEITP